MCAKKKQNATKCWLNGRSASLPSSQKPHDRPLHNQERGHNGVLVGTAWGFPFVKVSHITKPKD